MFSFLVSSDFLGSFLKMQISTLSPDLLNSNPFKKPSTFPNDSYATKSSDPLDLPLYKNPTIFCEFLKNVIVLHIQWYVDKCLTTSSLWGRKKLDLQCMPICMVQILPHWLISSSTWHQKSTKFLKIYNHLLRDSTRWL